MHSTMTAIGRSGMRSTEGPAMLSDLMPTMMPISRMQALSSTGK